MDREIPVRPHFRVRWTRLTRRRCDRQGREPVSLKAERLQRARGRPPGGSGLGTILSTSQLPACGTLSVPAVLGRRRLPAGDGPEPERKIGEAVDIREPDGAGLPSPPLPATGAGAATRGLVGRTVADVERDLILDTLDHCLGNRTRAAKILGISIRTLRNKLADYIGAGIEVAEPGGTRSAA